MLNWIMIMLLPYFTTILLSYYGDYIILLTRLRSYRSIEAEIIDCQYIQSFKGGKYITIVTYMQYTNAKNAVLSHVKGDKIGDKVEIITDGNYAVRSKKVYFVKKDIIKLLLKGLLAVGLGLFAYIKLGRIPIWLVIVIAGVCMFCIVLYPLYVVSRSYDMKVKLGWLDDTKAKSLQQKIDDKILIGVGVGALLILFVACHFIVNN